MEEYLIIAVLGAGYIGGTLGVKWAQAGQEIIFGMRDQVSTNIMARLAEAGGNATARTVSEAIVASEVVLLAFPH